MIDPSILDRKFFDADNPGWIGKHQAQGVGLGLIWQGMRQRTPT